MELNLCPDCGCHVFAGKECPFCSREARGPRKMVVGLIAGAITLGSFGCAYGMPDERCEGGTCDTGVSDTASPTDTAADTARDSGGDATAGD